MQQKNDPTQKHAFKENKFVVRKMAKKARRKQRVTAKMQALRVMVSNLKEETTKEDILAFFSELKVREVLFLLKRGDKTKHIGKCYVIFENDKHLELAMKMDGKKVLKQEVKIERALPKPKDPVEKRPLETTTETAPKKKKSEEAPLIDKKDREAKEKKQVVHEPEHKIEKVKEKSKPKKEDKIKPEKKEKKEKIKPEVNSEKKEKKPKQEVKELSPEEVAAKSVYVGNISRFVHAPQLKQFFKHCGDIAKCNFARNSDAKSLGWATIQFKDRLGRTKALLMNGKTLKNREIQVTEYVDQGKKTN